MVDTSNEAFRDALVRHQVGLMRFAGHVRNRVIGLLDAAERDMRERIERSTAGLRPEAVQRGPGLARLEALEGALTQMRGAAFDRALGAWNEELQGLAQQEPAFVAAAMQASVPVVLDLALPDAARLRALVRTNPFEGKALAEWGRQLKAADRERILQQVRIGILQGDAPADIARRVVGSARLSGADGATEITRRAATSLTRTSVNHFANEAKKELYTDNSDIVSEEVFVATLDSRTTAICASLDGRRFPVGEGPRPPMHIGCRSTRVAVIDGQVIGTRPLKASSERELVQEFAQERGLGRVSSRDALPRGTKGEFDAWARRQVRTLTGSAPAELTYSEFLKRQSRAFQEEVLGVEKARLFRQGVPLDRFVDSNFRPLTLDQLRARGVDDLGGLNVAMPQVGQRVESLLQRGLSNQEVADAVKREFPEASTSAASVASVKTALRKQGVEMPTTRVDLERSLGADQALEDIKLDLPAGLEPPTTWKAVAPGDIDPSAYSTYLPGKGVVLNDRAMKGITRQQAKQVAAHELGHYLHKERGLTVSEDELRSLRQAAASLEAADRKRLGYYLTSDDELIGEVYAQALSPSPVTSQGLSAAAFNRVFADQIAAARLRLSPTLAKKASSGAVDVQRALGSERFTAGLKPDPNGEWVKTPLSLVGDMNERAREMLNEASKGVSATALRSHFGSRVTIDPKGLSTIQPAVAPARVQAYINDPSIKPDKGGGVGGLPLVARIDGRLIALDGNHRITAALLSGRKLEATVLDMDKAFALGAKLGKTSGRDAGYELRRFLIDNPKKISAKAAPQAQTAATVAEASTPTGVFTPSSVKPDLDDVKKFMGTDASRPDKAFLPQLDDVELAGLRGYVGESYWKVNRALRGDIYHHNGSLDHTFRGLDNPKSVTSRRLSASLSAIDSGLKKLDAFDGEVQRFMLVEDASKLDDMLSVYKPGVTLTERAYVSTTRGRAERFTGSGSDVVKSGNVGLFAVKPNVRMKIRSKTGRVIPDDLAQIRDEDEVLFGRGTKFRVLSVKQTKEAWTAPNGRKMAPQYEIEMEEV